MQTQKVSDLLIQIGDVAKQLNIPASTIRYYEKIGLIKNQSRVSGRRCFDQNTLSTLQFIKLAQSVGFTITETKGLLEHFNNEPQKQQQLRQNFIHQKQMEIRKKIADLQQMDNALTRVANCECTSIENCIPEVASISTDKE